MKFGKFIALSDTMQLCKQGVNQPAWSGILLSRIMDFSAFPGPKLSYLWNYSLDYEEI